MFGESRTVDGFEFVLVLVYRLLNPFGFARPRPDQLAVFRGGPSRTGGGDEHI